MKGLICSLLLVLSSFFLKAQTSSVPYPVKQGVANAPKTELVTNTWYGKGIVYSFADTTAANADAYIKYQPFAFIATDSPIALWIRDLPHTVWLQLSVSGSPTVSSWLTRGNDLSTQSLPNRLGTKNGDLLNIITSDLIRAIIPAGGIVRSSSAQNRYLMQDTVGKEIYYGDFAGGITPTWQQTLTAGSTLNATNTIESTTFPQLFNWTGLTQNALILSAVTTAAIPGQTLFSVSLSGANAAAGRTTYAANIQNLHTGTTSTNYGLFLSASGGTAANYALVTNAGDVLLNQLSGTTTFGSAGALSGIFKVGGSSSGTITFQPQAAAGTYNWNWPTTAGTSGQPLLSGGGGATAMSFGTLSAGGGGTGNTATITNTYIAVGDGTKYVPTDPSTITTLPYIKLTGTSTATGDITVAMATNDLSVTGATNILLEATNGTIFSIPVVTGIDLSGGQYNAADAGLYHIVLGDVTNAFNLPDATTMTGKTIKVIMKVGESSPITSSGGSIYDKAGSALATITGGTYIFTSTGVDWWEF